MLLLVAGAAGAWRYWRQRHTDDPGRTIQLVAHTVTGNTGVAYLPAGARSGPLLVWLHGSGEHVDRIARRLAPFADREGFALLVPDSVSRSGWNLADRPGELSTDQQHVMACVAELLARPDFEVDRTQVLVAGFSAGGSEAPALASRDPLFTAFAILHGGVMPSTLGPRHVRGWLSTGQTDTVRSTAQLAQAAATLRGQGFTDLHVETVSGGHMLFDPEVEALVRWWLD